jgi:hypothetical protein
MTFARRALLVLVGAALGVGASFVPVEPTHLGGRTLEGFALFAAGVAVAAVGLAAGPFGVRGALLVGAAFLGGAGHLGLTQPLWLSFLRVRMHEIGAGLNPLFAAFVAVEAAVALASLRRGGGGALFRGLRALLRPQAVLPFLLLAASAAQGMEFLPNGRVRSFLIQCAADLGLTALHAATLFLAAREFRADAAARLGRRFGDATDGAPAGSRRVACGAAAFAFVASALLATFALDRAPHIPDEVAYLFQAETFAAGRLDSPASPAPEATVAYCVEDAPGRAYAVTPPGWPAVLALGFKAGAPWLVNPVLAALCVLLAHALARRLVGGAVADLVALLLAASPWFLFLAASYMTHLVSLAAMLAGWLGVEVAAKRRGFLGALLGGAAVGWLFLVRPLDGILIGGLLGLRALGLGGARLTFGGTIALGVGFLAVALTILPYHRHYTGDFFATPINAYIDELWGQKGANRLGFGPDVGNPPGGWGQLDPHPGHGPVDVAYNANHNLYCFDVDAWGFPTGSLLPLVLAVALRRRRYEPGERFAWWILLALAVGYSAYWFSGGPDFGPRYWFLMVFPAALLTASGLRDVARAAARGGRKDEAEPVADDDARGRVVAVYGASALFALCVFIPWRSVAKYRDYRGWHADYAAVAADPRYAGALVFVTVKDGGTDPDWLSARRLNSPFANDPTADAATRARPLFALDLGEEANRRLAASLPDRRPFRVLGRSTNGGRLGAVEPLPPK